MLLAELAIGQMIADLTCGGHALKKQLIDEGPAAFMQVNEDESVADNHPASSTSDPQPSAIT
jgi:hypothetical protein